MIKNCVKCGAYLFLENRFFEGFLSVLITLKYTSGKREGHNSENNQMELVNSKQNIPAPEPDSIPDSSSPDSSSTEAGSIPDESFPEAGFILVKSSPEADSI